MTQITETTVPKYAGLSNKDIILTYHKMKDIVDTMESNLKKLRIQKTNDNGVTYHDITQTQADSFKKSEYYQVIHNVVKTLSPIVNLLEDCDTELKMFSEGLKK
jgi:hypothetical protein